MSNDSYAQPLPSIDFGRASKWMFSSPNWVVNFVWVFICGLLGMVLVGHFIFVGYQLEIFQNRVGGRADGEADFKLDKLGVYLVRGLIPVAVNFVLGLVLVVLFLVVMGGWALAFTAILGKPEGIGALFFVVPMLFGGLCIGIIAFFTILPLCMRAGITNNFAEGFNFNWAIDTAKRMWPTILMCFVYVFLLGLLAQVVGIFTCGIAFLVTIPWLQLAMTDIGIQAYDIYEAKGGQPIPLESI